MKGIKVQVTNEIECKIAMECFEKMGFKWKKEVRTFFENHKMYVSACDEAGAQEISIQRLKEISGKK